MFEKKTVKEIRRKEITLDKTYVRSLLPIRYENSNKGTYGTVLNIAGSLNYTGAAYLSTVAALKSGAGLACLATEANTLSIVASKSPDMTFLNLGTSEKFTIPKDSTKFFKDITKYRVISIGCGLSTEKPARDFVLKFLKENFKSRKPFVIDADAINALATADKMYIPENSVMTPHPLELSRIMATTVEEIQNDRIKAATEAADYLGCTVVLKGMGTIIAPPNIAEVYVNKTGNSALAKGGSGDVLCGMISGFISQGLKIVDAACLAVYLHGKMGEIAANDLSEYSVLASNLIDYIPKAIKNLQGY